MRTIKIDQSISSKLEEHSDQRKSAQVGDVFMASAAWASAILAALRCLPSPGRSGNW